MAELVIELIPALSDNYLFLAYDRAEGVCAIIDPADADPVEARLQERGLKLTHILNTHHHMDHVGANLTLKDRHGLTIVGPAADRDRIPGIDVALSDGETYLLGSHEAKVFDVPGHTRGHIAYWFAADHAAFVGDTLFALGCGRLFEGTPKQMWASLNKLMALPPDTKVYCAHEYTQSNAAFALTVDPDNEVLQARARAITEARERGEPTVPTTIGIELETNPFLRPDSATLRNTLNMQAADNVDVFAEVRARKDSF
ncbi:MAG: hydroxyacylglutathione hydrolase [Alphaproteobacteria bacterium]